MLVRDLEPALENCPQSIAARLIGISVAALKKRIAAGRHPATGGRINVFEALEADRNAGEKTAPTALGSIETARLKRAQAVARERDNEIAAGRLVPVETVEELAAGIIAEFIQWENARSPRIAARLAAEPDPKTIKGILDADRRDALADLSARFADLANSAANS